ncbi:MAG TPA: calcium-binding protein [Nannocystaceae bacterium]|nr:calcium-binding protein [Nannocystaceae bacterium]
MVLGRLVGGLALVPTLVAIAACDPKGGDPGDGDIVGMPDDDGDDEPDDGDDEPDPGDPDPGDDPDDDPDGPDPVDDPEPRPTAAVPCDWEQWGGDACTMADGATGTSFCIVVKGEQFHTPCSTEAPECEPGEGLDMGCLGDLCWWDGAAFQYYSWEEPDCNTPLAMSFDGAPIELVPGVAASFDLSTDGSCQQTDWPTAPWLALDRDGDGAIESGAELFGNATPMASGGHAKNGFAALAELDSDRDGKITPKDARFGELVLWSDLDDDRIGTSAELRPLRDTKLVSIDLAFARQPSCDARGNCGYERAAFQFRSDDGKLAVGEIVDLHLVCR